MFSHSSYRKKERFTEEISYFFYSSIEDLLFQSETHLFKLNTSSQKA